MRFKMVRYGEGREKNGISFYLGASASPHHRSLPPLWPWMGQRETVAPLRKPDRVVKLNILPWFVQIIDCPFQFHFCIVILIHFNVTSIHTLLMLIWGDLHNTHGNTHHSESIEIVPEFRLAAVMGDSTYKYLLWFIAIAFAALLKENRECMDFSVC